MIIRGVRPYGGDLVDVLVRDGEVAEIGPGLEAEGEVLDGGGAVLLPGFVDLHVHLREPGGEESEDVATGSAAAALGAWVQAAHKALKAPLPPPAATAAPSALFAGPPMTTCPACGARIEVRALAEHAPLCAAKQREQRERDAMFAAKQARAAIGTEREEGAALAARWTTSREEEEEKPAWRSCRC